MRSQWGGYSDVEFGLRARDAWGGLRGGGICPSTSSATGKWRGGVVIGRVGGLACGVHRVLESVIRGGVRMPGWQGTGGVRGMEGWDPTEGRISIETKESWRKSDG
eukprot:383836-Hanusia_phi.AAC.1